MHIVTADGAFLPIKISHLLTFLSFLTFVRFGVLVGEFVASVPTNLYYTTMLQICQIFRRGYCYVLGAKGRSGMLWKNVTCYENFGKNVTR